MNLMIVHEQNKFQKLMEMENDMFYQFEKFVKSFLKEV